MRQKEAINNPASHDRAVVTLCTVVVHQPTTYKTKFRTKYIFYKDGHLILFKLNLRNNKSIVS